MANTLPNFNVGEDSWLDVYMETGITEGSDLAICNRGSSFIVYQESATQPSDDNEDGQLIGTVGSGDYQAIVTNVSSKVWLKSLGDETPVNVQAI